MITKGFYQTTYPSRLYTAARFATSQLNHKIEECDLHCEN